MTTKNQQKIELQSAIEWIKIAMQQIQRPVTWNHEAESRHVQALITAATEASKDKCDDCGADMMDVCSGLHFASGNEKCRTHESVEFYKAEAARLRSEVPEWLPIESAPKSQRVWLATWIEPSGTAKSNGSKAYWHVTDGIFIAYANNGGVWSGALGGSPNYWMPYIVPAPPKSTAQAEREG